MYITIDDEQTPIMNLNKMKRKLMNFSCIHNVSDFMNPILDMEGIMTMSINFKIKN